jgi:glycosyltransferase involved in cell wall biosynthesis
VYVDSGSTDGSVARAAALGVSVVQLEIPPMFTAARARNAGLERLLSDSPDLQFVQMVDGDCEIHGDWIAKAMAALAANPKVAGVYGRLRERFPERSVYNALCDEDWNVPVGDAPIVGGIALFRVAALRQVNLYDAEMIAGEEPDMAMRMRKRGWLLRRIDAEMGFHDVDITRFAQWWKRTRRTGHAYAELAFRHPDAKNPDWPRTTRSIIFWGALVPLSAIGAAIMAIFLAPVWWIVVALVFLLWAMQILQLTLRKLRSGLSSRLSWVSAALTVIGKIPQFLGLYEYHRNRLTGRGSQLIEHKRSEGS